MSELKGERIEWFGAVAALGLTSDRRGCVSGGVEEGRPGSAFQRRRVSRDVRSLQNKRSDRGRVCADLS